MECQLYDVDDIREKMERILFTLRDLDKMKEAEVGQ